MLYLHWLESQNKLKMLKIARRSFLRISFSFHCRRAPQHNLTSSTSCAVKASFAFHHLSFFSFSCRIYYSELISASTRTLAQQRTLREISLLFYIFLLRVSFLFITHSKPRSFLDLAAHSWTVSHIFRLRVFADVVERLVKVSERNNVWKLSTEFALRRLKIKTKLNSLLSNASISKSNVRTHVGWEWSWINVLKCIENRKSIRRLEHVARGGVRCSA